MHQRRPADHSVGRPTPRARRATLRSRRPSPRRARSLGRRRTYVRADEDRPADESTFGGGARRPSRERAALPSFHDHGSVPWGVWALAVARFQACLARPRAWLLPRVRPSGSRPGASPRPKENEAQGLRPFLLNGPKRNPSVRPPGRSWRDLCATEESEELRIDRSAQE